MNATTNAVDSKKSQVITQEYKNMSPKLMDELKEDINTMLTYAIHNGIIINTDVNNLIQNNTSGDLLNAYNLLVKNVSPATPKSIKFLNKIYADKTKSSYLSLPLVRNLIFLAIFFLISFVLTGMSSHVNNDSLDKGIMNNNGLNLLLNMGYLASVAGLGVLFSLLKKISNSIDKGSLVLEEGISYLTQILLGIISGLILSEVISFYKTNPDNIDLFSKSVLALIGGFSSDAIFIVLEGIINRIKSIFQ